MAINNVVISGRLTRDPEIKYTQSGKAVASISVAVNRRFKKDETDFFDCVAWEKLAELAAEYLRKGSLIGIIGSLRQDRYEKDGQKRSKIVINIEQLEFLESKKTSAGANSNSTSEFEGTEVPDDDDFPF
jgi:single-strand DNA-binding protein